MTASTPSASTTKSCSTSTPFRSRFIQLCAALKEEGGLNFILERFSAVMAGAWERVTGGGPPRSCRDPDGLSFLDLREAGGLMIHSTCWLVAEHTEWDMMRSLRAVSPGMKVYIGNEEMGRESNVFADGWRGLIKEHTGVEVPKVEVTPPADERTLNRDRTYAVRFRLDARLGEVTLDELREFLNREARKNWGTPPGKCRLIWPLTPPSSARHISVRPPGIPPPKSGVGKRRRDA